VGRATREGCALRVLAATTAGSGHFEPMVPVLRACAEAGHEVVVACPDSFVEQVTGAGLPCAPFDDAPPDQLGAVFGRLQGASYDEGNRVVIAEVFATLDTNAALSRLGETFRTVRPDVVVREPAEFASWLLSSRDGVPQVRVAAGLLADEPRHAAVAAPALEPAGQSLGLGGDLEPRHLTSGPVIAAAPAGFDPPDGLDEGTVHRIGIPPPAPLPQPLQLPGGDGPMVYVTFGTVAAGLGLWPGLYRTAIDALADLEARVLVTTGRGVDLADLGPVPPQVTLAEFVPQAHLLPYAAVMVTHGGYGTVLGGLRAGVPMVVTPMFADQADNAARVDAVGAGVRVQPSPIPLAQPPELGPQIATAVQQLLDDPQIRDTAGNLATEMAQHPPVSAAVALIEDTARTGRGAGYVP
jgi:UDP:flavonoid glycosyltransferase YjiC (YdhE family)